MAICGCDLPAHCCQPAVAGGFIMQISGVSLTLTWPHRLCLLKVLLCVSCCYKLSPFQEHWGRWHCTRFLWPVFIYSSRGKWVFSLSCGVFLPLPVLQAFPLLVAEHVPPLLPSLARLVYLQFCEGFPSPLFDAQGAPPSLLCVFIVVIAYYSVSLFSLCGGWSVQGPMLFWPRLVCGSTAYRLAHLVHIFPSHLGSGVWRRPRGPPCFSI
jgi:hypothetical protein